MFCYKTSNFELSYIGMSHRAKLYLNNEKNKTLLTHLENTKIIKKRASI